MTLSRIETSSSCKLPIPLTPMSILLDFLLFKFISNFNAYSIKNKKFDLLFYFTSLQNHIPRYDTKLGT